MAGTFPGTANAQQHDINGQPLASCILTVYQGGTTTPANVFQDIGLLLPAPNPLIGDATGRIPLFFVADGTYALRLTDQFGVQTNGGFFYPQIPSIGASSSGGGGTPVDPTTVFSTGDWKWRPSQETLTGWARLNGKTIGNAASGGSERANADTQALFIYAWNTYADSICQVVGGRGASGIADFNANKQITLLDMRGRAPFGLDDMGNAAAGAYTNITFTKGSATTGGSSGGNNLTTLTTAQLPTFTPTVQGFTLNASIPIQGFAQTGSAVPGNVSEGSNNGGLIPTPAAVSGTITMNAIGGGQAIPSVPGALLGTAYWKL